MGRALAVIIWILTLGSVSLFFIKKWWFPTSISEHAPAIDRQFKTIDFLSSSIFRRWTRKHDGYFLRPEAGLRWSPH